MRDDAIARHGYPVLVDGRDDRRGDQRDALADPRRADRDGLPPAADAALGASVEVVVRERRHPAEQVKLPFYRRPKPDAA